MNFLAFILVFVRMSVVVFLLPLFNMRNIPAQVKAGLSALLALFVAPQIGEPVVTSTWFLVVLVLNEAAVGLVIVFITVIVFGFIYFAGQLVDVPMGFGMVSVFDPSTGMQLPVFSQFYHLIGSLVFFSVDGHLWLFRAVLRSYQALPIGSFFDHDLIWQTIISLSGQLFSVGLQIAIPVMGTILLTDIALGIIIRTVPQINVFVIGFPIKIAVGLVVILFVIPVYVSIAAGLFGYDGLLFRHIYGLISQGGS